MIKYYLFITLMAISNSLISQNGISVQSRSEFSIGETIHFYSTIMEEDRTINIYLPAGYKNEHQKNYPVIYLLDGSADEDFIHIAGLVQFGTFPWINMLPETIVIGIANVDRKRDFTFPSNNEEDKTQIPTSGGASKFIQFIGSELIPLIDREYRTTGVKSIIGQSLGGLLATQVLFINPDLFDNYFIISPSLWWDDESLLDATPEKISAGKNIYIGVGKEGEVMERVAKELYQKIKANNTENLHLYFNFFEERNHGDVLHLAIYDAFEKIFRKMGKS